MASDDSVTFSITDANNNQIASGTLLYNPDTNAVDGISGTIDGNQITGLSTLNGADNQLTKNPNFVMGGGYFYSLDVDNSGIGIATSTGSYNLNDVGAPNNFGKSAQAGDTLTDSAGQSQTVTFAAGGLYQQLCFAQGALIATTHGPIAVDQLQEGDRVLVADGSARSIIWLGCRSISYPSSDQCPVRIRAGAFGGDLPERDLFLSPGHPVLVGDHLVPIMCLINGTTIARHPVESVTYWHVELDQHDILLAEGLPCESYIDLGSRPWFDGSDAPLHDPEFVAADMPGRCRPVAIDGPIVEAERLRLDAVFAGGLEAHCSWPTGDADVTHP